MDELIVCKPCGITFFPKNFFLLEKKCIDYSLGLGYDGCYDLGTCPSDYTCDTMSLDDYG